MKNLKKQLFLKLKKGNRYSICSCGISNRLPFCDGGHKKLNQESSSNYKSVKITASENVEISLDCANWEGKEKDNI